MLEAFRQHPAWSTVHAVQIGLRAFAQRKESDSAGCRGSVVSVDRFPLQRRATSAFTTTAMNASACRRPSPATSFKNAHCELADDGILADAAYAMPYEKETCAPLEEALEPRTEPRAQDPVPQENRHYLVTLKGGHVGKHRYYPVTLPILADSIENAKQ
ncbi:MAG: hypothetical protein MZU84_07350 [Sphingobacterium sp.]|nr:hypothetical protein [Sphingobacterium sp.]